MCALILVMYGCLASLVHFASHLFSFPPSPPPSLPQSSISASPRPPAVRCTWQTPSSPSASSMPWLVPTCPPKPPTPRATRSFPPYFAHDKLLRYDCFPSLPPSFRFLCVSAPLSGSSTPWLVPICLPSPPTPPATRSFPPTSPMISCSGRIDFPPSFLSLFVQVCFFLWF